MTDWTKFKEYCGKSDLIYHKMFESGCTKMVEAHRVYKNRHGILAEGSAVFYVFGCGGREMYHGTDFGRAKAEYLKALREA